MSKSTRIVALAAIVAVGFQPGYLSAAKAEVEETAPAQRIESTGAAVAPALLESLKHSDSNVRKDAANSLGELGAGANEVVPALIEALKDEDRDVVESAARALGRIGPAAAEAVPALLQALEPYDTGVQNTVVKALGKIGPAAKDAVPALIVMLGADLRYLRESAATSLGEIGPAAETAVPVLIEALKDDEGFLRKYATKSLAQIGPAAIPALIEALRDDDEDARASAVLALTGIGPSTNEVATAFIDALNDKSRVVRRNAAIALAWIGPVGNKAVPYLIKSLKDEDRDVRRYSAFALGQLGAGEAEDVIPALIEALEDQEALVRKAAADSLGELGPAAAEAIPALKKLLTDEQAGWQAAAALTRMGPTGIKTLVEALKDDDSGVRRRAASGMSRGGAAAAEAVPALIEAMRDENSDVRQAASDALGRIGPVAVPALVEALKDANSDVRQRSAKALALMGPAAADAVPALIEVMRDNNSNVREDASAALRRIGAAAVPNLVETFRDEDSELRRRAGDTLAQIGSAAVPALNEALNDKDSVVQQSAAYSLGRIMRLRSASYLKWLSTPREFGFVYVPKPKNYVVVPVFYATDRKPKGTINPREFFGAERGNLSLGVAEVSIPLDHRMGELEAPSLWRFWRFEYKPDPTKHVVLLSVQPLDRDTYFQALRSKIAGEREVLVFIHGFHVTFEDAARRTAQLAYDLNFQGAPVLYSWPSKGRAASYLADEASVRWTRVHLIEFLEALATSSGASTIHLVAHSMGNRALTEALADVTALNNKNGAPIFNQVVLTAPDIDAGVFLNLVKRLQGKAHRVTLYASSKDKALRVSKSIHEYPRAGEAGHSLVVVKGVDTIDASQLDTNLIGHSYYGENRSVVTDLFQLLKHKLPPSGRAALRPRVKYGLTYWEFQP